MLLQCFLLKMNVYIVGVYHPIQYIPHSSGPEWAQVIRDFKEFIQEQCRSLNIDLIAEEFSEYSLQHNPAQDSTTRSAANALDISFLFCDPDPDERLRLDIQTDPEREKEWLDRIIKFGKNRILFICGETHIESFKTLVLDAGHKADIVGSNWGAGYEGIN